jgi:hypothetical protein
MNRREFLDGTAAVFGSSMLSNDLFAGQSSHPALPEKVASVRIPDSAIARAATDLIRSASQPFLFNHCIRTFLFGALVGRSLGLSFDEEVFYLACVLHDLGLTEAYEGVLPFELQGAEAAKKFLHEHGYSPQKAAVVWDGIAMHASMISKFKQPEIMLVGEGAGADVLGPDASHVTKSQTEEIVAAFPRLQFKKEFLCSCASVVRKYPDGATRSFMRDVGERYVEDFHPKNFCDLVLEAPFSE